LSSNSAAASPASVKAGWILTILSALVLFADAFIQFFGMSVAPESTRANVELGGWHVEQTATLGIIVLVSAILYLVPRTAVLGAILVTGFYAGAVATELRIGGSPEMYVCVVLGAMAWGGLYLRDARVRALLPFTRPG
jgi:DoxX-like family